MLEDEEETGEVEVAEQESAPVQRQQPAVQQPAPAQRKESPKTENRLQKRSGGENVVAINQKHVMQKPQITIIEPRLYSEVQEVAD